MIRLWKLSLFKKIFCIFFLLSLALFALADRYSHLELFAQTLNLIKIHYFQPVKIQTLVYGAIKGLLREIDSHSHLLIPEELEKLKEETSGRFYGLGIEVEKKENFLIVISVIRNSPAQKAGLQQGDKILKIDDEVVKNFNVNEFYYFFKKSQNKKYKLTVLRIDHNQLLVFHIRPAHLKVQSVYFKKIEKGLFYIRIYYFSEKTLFEVNQFLKKKKIKGLLLDLRGNPGGIFEQSIKIADLFLNEGLIVRYKIKTEKEVKKFPAHYSNTLPDFPLVVLVDEYSASASEIVAGALKRSQKGNIGWKDNFWKSLHSKYILLKQQPRLKIDCRGVSNPIWSIYS